jgi:DNA-binding response OmpR family regulator
LSGNYAIVVLDVMMPRLNGLDVLRAIRRESTLPVLMLTARGDDADRVTGLELGADDYVTKPCTPRELAARIRAILRRTTPGSAPGRAAGSLTCGALTLWPEQRRAEWVGEPLVLTSTEFSVLELLLRHAGRPVSKADLSEHALGRPLTRHDRSIDVHVSSVRRKLGLLADGRSRRIWRASVTAVAGTWRPNTSWPCASTANTAGPGSCSDQLPKAPVPAYRKISAPAWTWFAAIGPAARSLRAASLR